MPARKPVDLSVRHSTRAEMDARALAESAMTSARRLPESEPATLIDHPVASREWRKLIRLYNGLDADIVSRLDMGMLLDYCVLIEQLEELDSLRKSAMDGWRSAQKMLEKIQEQKSDDEPIDMKTWIKALEAVNWAYDKIVKIDGRVDRKRALLLQLRQSLYLTPRSRAGVAPKRKEPEKPDEFADEFDQ